MKEYICFLCWSTEELPGLGWVPWCLESGALSFLFVSSDIPLFFLLCVYMKCCFHAHGHFVKPQSSPFHLPERKKGEKELATLEGPFLVSLSLCLSLF